MNIWTKITTGLALVFMCELSNANTSNCRPEWRILVTDNKATLIQCLESNQIINGRNAALVLEIFREEDSSDLAGVTLSLYELVNLVENKVTLISRMTGMGDNVLTINYNNQNMKLILADLNRDMQMDWAIRTESVLGSSLFFMFTYSNDTDGVEIVRPYYKKDSKVLMLDEDFVNDPNRDLIITDEKLVVPTLKYPKPGKRVPIFDEYEIRNSKFIKIR